MNTKTLLDALKALAGSDRKAAARIGVSQQAVNRWRLGHSRPDDDSARRIADALQLDHAYVLAVLHADRAETDETRATWQRIAAQFSKAAAVVMVASAGLLGAPEARADLTKSDFARDGNTHWRRNRRHVLGVAV